MIKPHWLDEIFSNNKSQKKIIAAIASSKEFSKIINEAISICKNAKPVDPNAFGGLSPGELARIYFLEKIQE